MVPVTAYLILAAVLFGVGALGVLISRNLIILFMSVELMLNAANLALIAFARAVNVVDGQVVVFLVLTVAAAEAAVGLSMIVTIFRNRETINVDRLNLLKW